jgi:hypothetical protein
LQVASSLGTALRRRCDYSKLGNLKFYCRHFHIEEHETMLRDRAILRR